MSRLSLIAAAVAAAAVCPGAVAQHTSSSYHRPHATAPAPAWSNKMYVAFSFAMPPLAGTTLGGDGTFGVGISPNEQTAIEESGKQCAIHSSTPDHCGTGNGGNFEVCRGKTGLRWVALVIANDGTAQDWSDGEAVGTDTEKEAVDQAFHNCGRGACTLLYSHTVQCGKPAPKVCHPKDNTTAWIGAIVAAPDDHYSVHPVPGGEEVDRIGSYTSAYSTVPWAAYGNANVTYLGPRNISVGVYPKDGATFPSTDRDNTGTHSYQAHQLHLTFGTVEAAKQAFGFFEYHGCIGK